MTKSCGVYWYFIYIWPINLHSYKIYFSCQDPELLVEIYFSCLDPALLVEIYFSWLDPELLVEIYFSCQDPEFLVEIYFSCHSHVIYLEFTWLIVCYLWVTEVLLPSNLHLGFPIRHMPPLAETVIMSNNPSTFSYPKTISDYFTKEVTSGRLSGPFSQEVTEQILCSPFQSSSLIVFVQPQEPGVPDKLRVCQHLSKTSKFHMSVNSHIHKDNFPTHFDTHHELCNIRKQFYRLQHLAKSYIPPSLNLGPPTTCHKILTTLLLAHASILVCLRFGVKSSSEDLSRLWNWLFHLWGLIPVWMAPSLMAIFSKFPSRIETSLQGDFQGACRHW